MDTITRSEKSRPRAQSRRSRAWPGSYDLASQPLAPSTLRQVDCVAVLTNHSTIDYDLLVAEAPLIIDTRNAIKGAYPHVFRLGAPKPLDSSAAEFAPSVRVIGM